MICLGVGEGCEYEVMVHIGSFKEDESFREGVSVFERSDLPEDVFYMRQFRISHSSNDGTSAAIRREQQDTRAEAGIFNRIRLKEPFFAQVQLCLANSLSC